MKVGLLSDPHANRYGTEAALGALAECDLLLCGGDLTGYFSFPNETITLLREARAISVRGNHDQFLEEEGLPGHSALARSVAYTRRVLTAENRDYLARLPQRIALEVDGMRILMVHGSPWDELNEYVYPDRASFEDFASVDADVIVLGHTHRPMIRRVGEKVIVNPGSCGQPRHGTAGACWAILETRTREARLGETTFDMQAACAAAVEAGLELPWKPRERVKEKVEAK